MSQRNNVSTPNISSELAQRVMQAYQNARFKQTVFFIAHSSLIGVWLSWLALVIGGFYFLYLAQTQVLIDTSIRDLQNREALVLGTWLLLALLITLIVFAYKHWRYCHNSNVHSLNLNTFLLHLNRIHPTLEESAQLSIVPVQKLSLVQRLQLERIKPAFEIALGQKSADYLSKFSVKSTLISVFASAILGGLLLIGGLPYVSLISSEYSNTALDSTPSELNVTSEPSDYLNMLGVSVLAPEYTKQQGFTQSSLNLEVLEGSAIDWTIPMSQLNAKHYMFALTLSSGQTIVFDWSEGYYRAQHVAINSAVYSISQMVDGKQSVSDIATIAVSKDAKPLIQIKHPMQTTTEFDKNEQAILQAEVEILDDFGIAQVTIMASVAKGSGEAVKFRDEEFIFDEVRPQGEGSLYIKTWDLAALDMTPGDELYFTVHATDIKSPTPQTSISPTRILRWLEDEKKTMTGAGIVIDFMPEYLKSQRQIIIETEALIAQKKRLSEQEFSRISRALAIDQQDLKQTYGQYLGDEVDSGALRTMEDGMRVPGLASGEHDHEEGDHNEQEEKTNDKQVDQAHQHEQNNYAQNDISGYSEIIERYGHNHGEADVGFIKTFEGQINPKVLMKRAVAHMWDAELQLQLSQPSLALPYEKQALDYLNRAKQAERIYVKRLGFEPPPVTEERRYSGKLNDILSYQRDISIALAPDQYDDFLGLIALLNRYTSLNPQEYTAIDSAHETKKNSVNSRQAKIENVTFSAKERVLIDRVTATLTEQLSNDSAWLKHVATLKQIQLKGAFNLDNCDNCLAALLSQLHNALPKPIAQPGRPLTHYSYKHKSISAYAEALERLQSSQNEQHQ